MTTEIKNLKLDDIRIDGGTQSRVAINEQTVADYAEHYCEGAKMPPVTVFYDGATYWLADGFHRYWANKKIDCDYIFGEVHAGTQRDAILYSVGANTSHGLRRTNADKRKAILMMFEDEDWAKWSNREIAKQCGVSEISVRRMRDTATMSQCDQAVTAGVSQYESSERTFIHPKTGKPSKMRTTNIGRQSVRRPKSLIAGSEMNPVRQPRPVLAQTNLNLPHDPIYGAQAIVSAMGEEYAEQLIESLAHYLENRKEGTP